MTVDQLTRICRRATPTMFIAVISCLLLCSSVQSQDQDLSPNDGPSKVERLVDQLDATSRAQRRQAQELLMGLGPDILDELPDGRGMSMEATERLQKVRQLLMKSKARKAVAQREVQIRLDDIETLDDALEAISIDGGLEFAYDGDRSIPIQPVAAPLTLWHAIDYVLDSCDLDTNPYSAQSGEIALVRRRPERPSRVDSAAYTGVYRLEPTLISSRRSMRDQSLSGLHINMEIAWPPTITPIGLALPVDQLSATTDTGQSLRPQASGKTIDIATSPAIAQSEFYLPFELPQVGTERLQSVRGVVEALLPGKQERFELPLDAVGQPKTIDAMTVKVNQLIRRDALVEVRIDVQLKNPGRALESHRHWIFENEAFVLDEQRERHDHFSFEVYQQSDSGVGMAYLFDLGTDLSKYRFIYSSPVAVISNKAEFLLSEVPLP